ncbi:MAG: hypothetical protein JO077_22465 [Verrucomicrobia bacterium]|nr:hypothetical protein [Verrucomicrobiota bacterium]
MPDIVEIRILPPLAIGRLGSSATPLENYTLEIANPVGYRSLVPAPTLVVDPVTGAIVSSTTPAAVSFRDAKGNIKPVCPFLEVWMLTAGAKTLAPLTLQALEDLGADETAVSWSVEVGNIKAFRRTGDPKDKITASTTAFNDHGSKSLQGKCANFKPGKSLPFGSVRYLKPTADFPQIRLRFTPASGKVYGPKTGDPNIAEDVYDETRGSWSKFRDGDPNAPASRPPSTEPGGIFANVRGVSRGYLDDECDGIVQVQVTLADKALTAIARITCGPPSFAPDGLPIRSVADELEQVELGPAVSGPVPMAEVGSIVRRALETVRLMHTAALNSPSINNMANQDTGTGRAAEPIFDPSVVDALALRARHESVLLALNSRTMAWFSGVLRRYTEVGDLSNDGRRKMPGMMRGSDGSHLALTRRQASKVDAAALEIAPDPAPSNAGSDLTPTNLTAIFYHAQGNPPVAHPSSAISNAFPGLEMDFRNVWRRVFAGIILHEADNFVVDVEANASPKLRELIGQRLISVNGISVIGVLQGPTRAGGPVVSLPPNENAAANNPMVGKTNLEWSNCLADALRMQAKSVACIFVPEGGGPETKISLKVRPFFEAGTGVIKRELLQPGELTQSLCSPWQNDYRECSCYYWAASRPDYVNVEARADGTSAGHNWLQLNRNPGADKVYIIDDFTDQRLVTYEQLFRNWEHLLKFEIEGSDSE